jgi:peptidoglycan/LPS O-acetylase OafA/YrhL
MGSKTIIAPTKPHYEILDGLRGVAALLVLFFHIGESHFPQPADNPVHHGYLAVDFFFLLSGFVVGYAYDDRWGQMKIKDFLRIRLTRLHPMLIMGVIIGAAGFTFAPYGEWFEHNSLLKYALIVIIAMTLLPYPDLRGWGETHSLNGPSWSLLQEYIGNILYAVALRKFSQKALGILVVIFAMALSGIAVYRGDVGTGWSFNTCWIAFIRMMFPFFAGLMLFRAGKLIRISKAFLWCSLALALLFMLPTFRFNGIYEAVCIILFFPLIVAAGAGGNIKSNIGKRICKFLGDISFPLYITHYPLIYIYIGWVYKSKPTVTESLPVAAGLIIMAVVIAWLSLKLYDEPVRIWLRGRFLKSKADK